MRCGVQGVNTAGYTAAEKRTVLLACCLSGFITPLVTTMMNLSLVSIGEEFGVGSHAQAYINTAFLMSSVIFMVPLAKVADLVGKRRTYMAGVAVMLVFCLLASVSPDFWFLVMCRACMGAGAAAITTTSVSMIVDVFPGNRRGGAIGMQTMCVYIGLALGPAAGGLMNDWLGWHSVFYLIVPLAVASIAVMSRFRHEITPDMGGRMDMKGTALYAAAMFFTMGGVINLPEAWAVAMIPVGAVFLWMFVRSQASSDDCLLDIRLFRNRVFTGSCMAAFFAYAASYSVAFFLALYLQSIGGLTASEAGVLMLVQPAIQAVGTPVFGRVSDSVGDKRILPTVGIGLIGIGVFSLMWYGTDTTLSEVVATMAVLGCGFSVFSSPNTSVIMSSVPGEQTSQASSMVSFMRQTGMMLSMGVAMSFISVIMGSADHLVPENYADFLDVMFWSFCLCFVMCMAGMAASYLREGRVEGS